MTPTTAPHGTATAALVALWRALGAMTDDEARTFLHDKEAFLPGLDPDRVLHELAVDRARLGALA